MSKTCILHTVLLLAVLSSCSFSQNRTDIPENPETVATYDTTAEAWAKEHSPRSPLRGWEYAASRLRQHGIEESAIKAIFSDTSMPLWTPIPFKVRPQEPFSLYKKSNTPAARKNALEFYKKHRAYFTRSSKLLSVEPEIVLAILQIETQCGKNTGSQPIFYWLARLVSAGFPPNIRYNAENSKEDPAPTLRELEERAEWLEEEFIPHLIALIKTSESLSIQPISITGSHGGAIGLPQFLPGNIEKYGFDGDGDGAINLFVPADAIFSVANFLKSHGWKKGMSRSEKKSVILFYNRSNAYAETVLNMADALKKMM
jgi:membrane-bound lytic murein transglycosylase B